MKLADQVAIVTGAGRGIGKAIAVAFAAEGAKVVCAARSGQEIDAVADEIGGRAIACDVAKEAQVRGLIEQTLAAYGRIDILVNNAGAVARELTHELPVESWDRVIDVNLRGVFLCAKYALPSMLERGEGRIINISSGAGVHGGVGRSAYAASKHGVMGLTKVWAAEYRDLGIRAYVILPDVTESAMRKSGFPDEDPATMIQPEQIANAAVYQATESATAYTMVMHVHNGMQVRNRPQPSQPVPAS